MQSRIRRRVWAAMGGVGILVVGVAVGDAQQIWAGGYGNREAPRLPTRNTFAGSFNFCRVMFTSDCREKGGWRTDYPGADITAPADLEYAVPGEEPTWRSLRAKRMPCYGVWLATDEEDILN